jgi:hypothetical protein
MSLFHIENTRELDKELDGIGLERSGFLTWGEFLELLFKHKRQHKAVQDKENRQASPEGYVSDPELEKQNRADTERKRESPDRPHSVKTSKGAGGPGNPYQKLAQQRITGQDYKKRYKKAKKAKGADADINVTVPQPFRFSERESRRKLFKNIRQQKLDEMVQEKMAEEYALVHHEFRANPIPVTTMLPRFEMLQAAQEARRVEIKQQSYAQAKARDKPFSFYERDKDLLQRRAQAAEATAAEMRKAAKPHPANPVPWSVTMPIYQQMQQLREQQRQERIRKRAQESLARAELPARMKEHEEKKKTAVVRPGSEVVMGCPPRAREVPDFKKQQAAFQEALERHKTLRQGTVVEEFKLHETKVARTLAV